jgi:hypothetical protein
MPSPALAQPSTATGTGTAATTTDPASSTPSPTNAVPARSSVARDGAWSRPWNQEPVAQVTAATVSTSPAAVGDRPRSRDSSSGRNVSAPRNAPEISPRTRITLGSPGRARSDPAGNSRGPDRATAASAAAPRTAATGPDSCPASCSPAAPNAAPTAHSTRARDGRPAPSIRSAQPWHRPNPGSTSSAAGTASAAASRNTQRQPACSTSSPATGGPATAGSSQAAANAAKMRGRSAGGTTRPTTTYSATENSPLPNPCTARPTASTVIDGASPATSSPSTNAATPTRIDAAGPRASLHTPASTIPITLVASGSPNASAYPATPSSAAATVGIAVATAIASNAPSETRATEPTVSARSGPLSRVGTGAGAVSVDVMPVTVQPEPRLRSTGCEPGHSAASASTEDGRVPPGRDCAEGADQELPGAGQMFVAAPPSPASAGGLFVVLGWWAWHVLELLAELVTAGE